VVAACVGVPAYFYVHEGDLWFMLCPAVLIFLAAPAMRIVFLRRDGPALNRALARTGGMLLLYSVLFSVGSIL